MKSASQMKLNPSNNPTKSDFIMQVISSIKDGFIPSDRTDLVEKVLFERTGLFLSFVSEKELGENRGFFNFYSLSHILLALETFYSHPQEVFYEISHNNCTTVLIATTTHYNILPVVYYANQPNRQLALLQSMLI